MLSGQLQTHNAFDIIYIQQIIEARSFPIGDEQGGYGTD